MSSDTRWQLLQRYDELMRQVRSACVKFDRGGAGELAARDLSNYVRNLVHQQQKNHAGPLLKQLGVKDQLQYWSLPVQGPPWGLCQQRTSFLFASGAEEAESGWTSFVPLYDYDMDDVRAFLHDIRPRANWLQRPFKEWWEEPVLGVRGVGVLKRKDVVLLVAHKDGGAHVDLNQVDRTSRFYLEQQSGVTVAYLAGDRMLRAERGPLFATMRQIAFELQVSLSVQAAILGGTVDPYTPPPTQKLNLFGHKNVTFARSSTGLIDHSTEQIQLRARYWADAAAVMADMAFEGRNPPGITALPP